MILSELGPGALRTRLRGDGLLLRTGPFLFRVRSTIASVEEGLALLYADYPLGEDAEFADYTVQIAPGRGLHRWWRPQARYLYDGQSPFEPLPQDHAFPLLEWAMNWCIAGHAHHSLLLHAAVVERGGLAAILPAPPGSGKSTLCAGLVQRGWRLLSDEMTIIDLPTRQVMPLGRPISLKNASIEVMRAFAPGAVINAVSHETHKGSVTHMKVPAGQVARLHETARPRWVIFPRWQAGEAAQLTPRSQAQSFIELGRNAFNYLVLGEEGFQVLGDVVQASDCFDFRYSRLDDAVAAFDKLARQA